MTNILEYFLAYVDSETQLEEILESNMDIPEISNSHELNFLDLINKMEILLSLMKNSMRCIFFAKLQELCFGFYIFSIDFFPNLVECGCLKLLEVFFNRLMLICLNTLDKDIILSFFNFFSNYFKEISLSTRIKALFEYLVVFLAFVNIFQNNERDKSKKDVLLDVINENASKIVEHILNLISENNEHSLILKDLENLQILVSENEESHQKIFNNKFPQTYTNIEKIQFVHEVIKKYSYSTEYMILVLIFLKGFLKKEKVKLIEKEKRMLKRIQRTMLLILKPFEMEEFDNSDIFKRVLFEEIMKVYAKMQDYSIEYLMEKEENDDQNDYVYEIQHCKVKLNLIHSTDLSDYFEQRFFHFNLKLKFLAAYIALIQDKVRFNENNITNIEKEYQINLTDLKFDSKWVSCLFSDYIINIQNNALVICMFQILLKDPHNMFYFAPYLFISHLLSLEKSSKKNIEKSSKKNIAKSSKKNIEQSSKIISKILYQSHSFFDKKIFVASFIYLENYIRTPACEIKLIKNFQKFKTCFNFLDLHSSAFASCGEYKYIASDLEEKIRNSINTALVENKQIESSNICGLLKILKSIDEKYYYISSIPIPEFVSPNLENFISFAFRQYFDKEPMEPEPAVYDEWAFDLIYAKLKKLKEKVGNKHWDKEHIPLAIQEIENIILPNAFLHINRKSNNLEFVKRTFLQCLYAKKIVKIFRLSIGTSYEDFVNLHKLLLDVFHSNQKFPDKLYSVLNLFAIFDIPPIRLQREFFLTMIIYQILKILWLLSKQFNFNNAKFIEQILSFLNQTFKEIDYFYHKKFCLLLVKINKIYPKFGFKIDCKQSVNKFCGVDYDKIDKNKSKSPPYYFYFFNYEKNHYVNFDEKMKRKEHNLSDEEIMLKLYYGIKIDYKTYLLSLKFCFIEIATSNKNLIFNLNQMMMLICNFHDTFLSKSSTWSQETQKNISEKISKGFKKFIEDAPSWKFVYIKDQILQRILTDIDDLNSPLVDSLILILSILLSKYPKQSFWWFFPLKFKYYSLKGFQQNTRSYKIYKQIKKNLRTEKFIMIQFRYVKIFLKRLLNYFLSFDSSKQSKSFPSSLKEDFTFSEETQFFVLPTIENLSPISPKLLETPDFSPYKENPSYIIGIQQEFHVYPSNSKPFRITFECYDTEKQHFKQNFLLKQDTTIKNEVAMAKLLEFSNLWLSQDKFFSEQRLTFPNVKITEITNTVALIEFYENSTALKSIYDEEMKASYSFSLWKTRNDIFLKIQNNFFFARKQKLPTSPANGALSNTEFHLLNKIPAVFPKWFKKTFTSFNSQVESLSNYTKTMALWSFFCYFVGLQDRHLENILINKQNGSLYHIDYNDITEIGRHHEIPDITNFRCTKNFLDTLGVFKGMGIFRFYFVQLYRFFSQNKWAFREFLVNCLEEDDLIFMMNRIEKSSFWEIENDVDELIRYNTDERNYKFRYFGWMADI